MTSQGHTVPPLPPAVEVLDRPVEETVDLKVWPVPGALAIFCPRSAEDIDFDVDLRELQGSARRRHSLPVPRSDRT
ncbi:hypothetical protein [Saccharothrix sp. ALI-22-I]|uniref:hypothetical protein n=1 Tax=Saccharothrix sp. ALI-22-I TaxID=1933778 RepID=UPI001930F720|nr:hypothetical protein [Saccharothrix sp. ALI-22-I]